MKKFLPFYLFLSLSVALQAQITIEASDLPVVGDEWETTGDGGVEYLDLGSTGGGQIWDFSDLQLNDVATQSFIDPVVLFDNVGDFPDADLAQTQVGSTRANLFDITDDAVYELGLVVQLFDQPFLTSVPYVPPVEVRALPTTMGTAFIDSFYFDLVLSDESIAADSVRLKHLEWRDSEIDAWGTMTTPSGTFDVLRERLIVHTIDSVWSYVGGAELFSSANEVARASYNWLAKEVGIPVVSVALDGAGQPASATWWVAESVAPPVPVYSYVYASGSGLLQFQDLSAFEPDSWFWEFGDNTSSFEQNPLHQYAAPGEYEVCLTVENQFGSNTACQVIYVFFAPEANFSFENQGGGIYAFTDLSTDTVTLWSWDFGDGETSIEQNPVHIYASEGDYEVCLTVSNAAGSDTYCVNLQFTTAVTELPLQEALKVYPNPASTEVFFDLGEAAETGDLFLHIENALGQEVYAMPFSLLAGGGGKTNSVVVSSWPRGVYVYRLSDETGRPLAAGRLFVQ